MLMHVEALKAFAKLRSLNIKTDDRFPSLITSITGIIHFDPFIIKSQISGYMKKERRAHHVEIMH